MALPDLYSRRKRQRNTNSADVYQYDEMPLKLRTQALHIFDRWNEGFMYDTSNPIYKDACDMLRVELGVKSLTGRYHNGSDDEFHQWFSAHSDIDELLDAVEICVRLGGYYQQHRSHRYDNVENDVTELNARMLEAGFGYQIDGGQVLQISSTVIHSDVVVPAMSLLSDHKFATANDEFRQAYQEFNQGNYDDCIHDCCNAFESVLKIILTNKGWAFSPNDTASKLLAVAFSNDLIPSYMQKEFTGLRTILESGVPTVRNKDGGHGAGSTPRNIPKHIAAFQLHQTAAAIILLVEAAK